MKIFIAENDFLEAEALMLDLKDLFSNRDTVQFIGPVTSLDEGRRILKSETDLDLAILDISLDDNEEDGGIKLANLVSGVARIPVIFISGLPRDKGFDLAKFSKPFSYLRKPYSKQALWDAVELAIQYNPPGHFWFTRKADIEYEVLYLKTAINEISPISIQNIILIEADDKILNLFTEEPFKKIVITSPGLKNFFQEKLVSFQIFTQINKKFVINSKKIKLIKDNHIHMLPSIIDPAEAQLKGFPKPIPLPTESNHRKILMKELGIKP
jgi:DNA-binding LytR/AlgR family response regulator